MTAQIKSKIILTSAIFSFLYFLQACIVSNKPSTATTAVPEQRIKRPVDVWAVRSVLDQRPRMLSIALHDKLWVAYNTQTGGLYKAWMGGVNFDGSVYTARHGVQPTSRGVLYMQEPDDNPWRMIKDGAEVVPDVAYKGHIILKNRVFLRYELSHQNNKIMVEEQPEVVDSPGGHIGFERIFTTSGVPLGLRVSLRMNGGTKGDTTFRTDGELKKEQLNEASTLQLNSNGKTRVYTILSPKPVEPLTVQAKLSHEEKIEAIIAATDCAVCHNKEVKTVGPSYMAIAQQYPNTLQSQEMLVGKVINGGAGNWGNIPMTPHPNLSQQDANAIVSYILSLDAKEEGTKAVANLMPAPGYPVVIKPLDSASIPVNSRNKGIAINAYQFDSRVFNLPEISKDLRPILSGSINALHLGKDDFGKIVNNFVIHATGFINVKKTTKAVFRLVSDGGSRLFIDNRLVINNDGAHLLRGMESAITLKSGSHPFRVEFFPGQWGKSVSLQWMPHGAKEFRVVPPELFSFTGSDLRTTDKQPIPINKVIIPGDTFPLNSVHPAFTLSQARPATFKPRVGGMDFLPDGRLVVCTWDSVGGVYTLEGVQGNNPENIRVKRIAQGLAEPLGLKVVDGDIYIMQKQELTRLIDVDKDGIIDEYRTVCNGWKTTTNFHEFSFGLVYQDGYFYATLATAIDPGGASTRQQAPDRGKVIKISKDDGSFSFVASGLRTPNGIGVGPDNQIFVADNQGDWLPSNKIVHVQQGAWYGSRSVDFRGTERLKATPPVLYLTQDEIAKSPSQPLKFNVGPYKDQLIFGDITYGGIQRANIEKVNGVYQGAVFKFSQGLEVGVNRLAWGPDGALYVGGVGTGSGGWIQYGKLSYGLQKLSYNNKSVFEMLAVKAKKEGLEIEFTEPLRDGAGTKASDYSVKQYWFKPTADYGGPKMDESDLSIKNITISSDCKKVILELPGLKPEHVVYLRLNHKTMKSESGGSLWTTEAWYTMNSIPR